ncbi:hypothetical protein KJ966_22285 [bacterium]|nr:hypothetical protein [bacterium]
MSNTKDSFSDYKIISSESKSWFVGKPGTNKNSFSVTWSPGAMVLYGEKGNVTLIYSQFNSYEKAKKWLADCDLEEFKGTIAHNHPEDIEYFYNAFRHWGKAQHFK